MAADGARKGLVVVSPAAPIEVAGDPPSFVNCALADLRAQIAAAPADAVGEIDRIIIESPGAAGTSEADEGFSLILSGATLRASGASWRGVHYAILELVRRMSESPDGASVPRDLNLREKPSFALRAMYAHTAWVYHNPYALRSWTLEDWKRYVDLLAYLKVNVLQIWNLVSIMPQPLSDADRQYLAMFHEVVRYAKEERAFVAVWVGDAANNVAKPDSTPIRDRQYYVVHSLRDPSEPAQLEDIMHSRQELYQHNANADGYWVIDSDPGNWPDSPSDDFVKVMRRNRQLLDRHTERKDRSELIYWIWQGWGIGSQTENLTAILSGLGDLTARSFRLLACFRESLDVISKYALLPRTTWFPYGAIEGEPHSPYTVLRLQEIRDAFSTIADYPQVTGVMGNAQTPLVQLPNLVFFHRKAWHKEYDGTPRQILSDAARSIFPRIADELASAWLALSEQDDAATEDAADALRDALKHERLGPAAVLARHLPAAGRWLVTDLLQQLRLHALALRLAQGLRQPAGAAAVEQLCEEYFRAALQRVETTGFLPAPDKHGKNLLPFFNWFFSSEDLARLRPAWDTCRQQQPESAQQIYSRLKARYGAGPPTSEMLEFLIGTPPQMEPGFKYAN